MTRAKKKRQGLGVIGTASKEDAAADTSQAAAEHPHSSGMARRAEDRAGPGTDPAQPPARKKSRSSRSSSCRDTAGSGLDDDFRADAQTGGANSQHQRATVKSNTGLQGKARKARAGRANSACAARQGQAGPAPESAPSKTAPGAQSAVSNWAQMQHIVRQTDEALKAERDVKKRGAKRSAADRGKGKETVVRPPGGARPKEQHAQHSKQHGGKRNESGKNGAAGPDPRSKEAGVHPDGVLNGTLVPKSTDFGPTDVVALDCEMVGVGASGARSALARVCVVNNHGNVLLDVFVQPGEKVTDFRTQYSGVRPGDLRSALDIELVSQQVHALLQGRVLVGHALHNDLKALRLEGTVPRQNIRDTALFPPLMYQRGEGRRLRSSALRVLVPAQLGVSIQEGEHAPSVDARAALYLYHKHRHAWEAGIVSGLFKTHRSKASAKIATGFKRQAAVSTPAATGLRKGRVVGHDDESSSDDSYHVPSAAERARQKANIERISRGLAWDA